MIGRLYFLILFLTIVTMPFSLQAQVEFDIETGAVFSGYNDVRIPGDGGTFFSLSENLSIDPSIYFRIRAFYHFNAKHHLGILIAPLSLNATGRLGKDLIFQDQIFPANTPLETTYRFNSYRLIYRYDFLRKKNLTFGLGFTAKIRDAEISVRGNKVESKKTNVGFVPILHFKLVWRFYSPFCFLLDGDALAAPQGRAADVLTAFTYQLSNKTKLKFGYRILEGGADNEEVYNFALVHYAVFGIIFHF